MTAGGIHVSTLWRRIAAATAIACVLAAGQAQANGNDPTVVKGQASFSAQGNTLSITNSPGAIINWLGFSIGTNETTRFIQQNNASSVLNRVVGPDPSVILGTLTSNGRVFLINPSGILVGQGARIDVAGLVASTLNLSNQDFLAGRLNFVPNPLAGKVENQGSITTPSGGSVYLVGAGVTNSGIITSPQGDVILAAGQSVKIFDSGTPGVRVEITASNNAAVNLGKVLAQSGEVGIYGAALRNTGIINADQVVRDANGKIVLRAKQDVTLEAGSRLSANGGQASEITVQSETGTTMVSGTIEASGTGAGQTGGTVHLLGGKVGLFDHADINVSGDAGGGTVLVGGDLHGANSAVQNASAIYMSADSAINADAITKGSGGKVVLWANDSTRAYGSIVARGGRQGGDGGLIETSGHWLDVSGINISAGAPNGKGGTWLLDPADVTITGAVDSGGSFSGGDPDVFSPDSGEGTANVNLTTITTALNLGTDVTITTTNSGTSGSGNGDISVDAVITWDRSASLPPPSILTLSALRDVNVNSAITATNGSFVADAGRDVNVKAVITTTGGDVVLRADSDGTGPGVAGGTVTFLAGGSVTMTDGAARIYYNPDSYATPTDYSHSFTLTNSTLTPYMWVFAQGNDKVYDGLTTASLSFIGNPTAGGNVTLNPGTASFDTKNAGTDKTINYSGFTIGGGDADKFALFYSDVPGTGTARAAITKRDTTVSGTRVYDLSTDAAGSDLTTVSSRLGSDEVSLTGVGSVADKTVGTNKAVTNLTLALAGADAGNYNLLADGNTLTITKRDTTGGITAADKAYDATASATITGRTLSGVLGADAVSYTGGAATFSDRNAADGKTVRGNGLSLTGADAGNYTVNATAMTAADITPAGLGVAVNSATRLYGDANPVFSVTYTGFQQGDSAAALNGTLAFSTSASPSSSVGNYAITASGQSSANYAISYVGGTLGIAPVTLAVAADAQSKVYGASDPTLTFGVTGLVNNPALGVTDMADSVLSGVLKRAGGETVSGGPYAITQGTLAANGNYTLSSFTGNNLVITGAAAEPILGFNAGQVIFAGVTNSETYYRPGNFWHISLNPNKADPGFDVMRGTNDLNSRLSRSMNPCDSVSGGGFCETWSFPQEFEKFDAK